MSDFPYHNLKPDQHWPKKNATDIFLNGPSSTKLIINNNTSIASAGSCFAQKIAYGLKRYGFNYLVTEPGPKFLSNELKESYNYGIFSARYGNIYSSLQLLRLIQEMLGTWSPEEKYWQTKNYFIDPFRPNIQPNGFPTVEELFADRSQHLSYVKEMFEKVEVFIFTLGLTEVWENIFDGAVYPRCPGNSIGTFDAKKYRFRNLNVEENMQALDHTINLLHKLNPNLKIILTVSPVPLLATASNFDVMQSSSYSKSVLRVVAEEFRKNYSFIDYFPSFEIITSPIFNNGFREDGRTISDEGEKNVFRKFFKYFSGLNLDEMTIAEDEVRDHKEILCDEEEVLNSIYNEQKNKNLT